MGYIVGAKMAELCGSWQWGLRATPVMGIVAVLLILLLLQDPPRGESEGHQHLQSPGPDIRGKRGAGRDRKTLRGKSLTKRAHFPTGGREGPPDSTG